MTITRTFADDTAQPFIAALPASLLGFGSLSSPPVPHGQLAAAGLALNRILLGNTSPGPKPTHVPDGPTPPTVYAAHARIVDNPLITPAIATIVGHGRGGG
jgi:hypothetical protein